jgi:hypothetical protein
VIEPARRANLVALDPMAAEHAFLLDRGEWGGQLAALKRMTARHLAAAESTPVPYAHPHMLWH